MNGKIGKFLAGIAILVATILGSMGSLPAHAGTNGQQLEIYNPYPWYAYACIAGYNQYGGYARQCVQLYDQGVTWDYNWWWTGSITLDYYGAQWQYLGSNHENVPSFQWNSDWYLISTSDT